MHPTNFQENALSTFAAAVIGVIVLAVAILLYRPFEARPFEFLDFPEFFGILENGRTLSERTRGLVAYYETHGRANVLAYFLLAVRWTIFGRTTPAWQLARFCVMCVVTIVTFLLARRLGASRVAAVLGASLYATTEASAQGWMRLSMMEPLATLFLLAAAIGASTFQAVQHWGRRLGVIALLVMAAILTKETMVAAVPLAVMVGLCVGRDAKLCLPARSRQNAIFVVILALASVIALIPTVAAQTGAGNGGYSSSYASGPVDPSRVLSFLLATFVPFDLFAGDTGAFLAMGSYALLGTAGLAAALRFAKDRRRIWIPLAIAVLVVLGGAAVYAPWPTFDPFYTIPYLVAPALLIALAITAVERYAPAAKPAAYLAVGCFSLQAISEAHANVRRTAAAQRLVDRAAVAVAAVSEVDTALFAVRARHAQAWQGTGPTISRYATAIRHLRFPPVLDVPCDSIARRAGAASNRVLVVVLSSQCAPYRPPDATVQERFQRWDWSSLSLVNDSLRADLLHPGQPIRDAAPTMLTR